MIVAIGSHGPLFGGTASSYHGDCAVNENSTNVIDVASECTSCHFMTMVRLKRKDYLLGR